MDMTDIGKQLKKIKIIYTDVDNTFVVSGCLFKNRKGYTLDNAAAIYDLLSAGVDIVMNSGRDKNKLKETARLLGFKNYIANMGMEIVYNHGEKIVSNYGIDVDNPQSLKAWIEDTGIIESLFSRFKRQVRYYTPWSDHLKTHPLLVGELNFTEIKAWVEKSFPVLRVVDNGPVPPENDFKSPHAYHIVPKDVGKKKAIQIDKKVRNLKRENILGIGDSLEDMTMADEVGVYFALDDNIIAHRKNIIYVRNEDGYGFRRIVHHLKINSLI